MRKNLTTLLTITAKKLLKWQYDTYKSSTVGVNSSSSVPMFYASGFTAALLAKEISKEWVAPLKQQARFAALSAALSLAAVAVTLFYVWSLVSFDSFSRFLMAFAPAVAALLFTEAKSYNVWAEARKHLAEASAIVSSGPAER
jgi:hypothetical protein